MKTIDRRDDKSAKNNDVENMVAEEPGAGQDTPAQQDVVREGSYATTSARRRTTKRNDVSRGVALGRLFSDKPKPEYLRFAAALRDATRARGMTASDVARKVWGSTKDPRGYDVARNRDRLGHYLAGTSYPSPANLERLAAAVGMTVEELAVVEQPIENNPGPRARQPNLPLVISEVSNDPGIYRVQVDQHVDFDTARQIWTLLEAARKKIAATRLEQSRELLGQLIQGGADDDDGDGDGDGDRETA